MLATQNPALAAHSRLYYPNQIVHMFTKNTTFAPLM